MSPPALDHSPRASQEDSDLAHYEAINPWAVVALVLGVLSVAVVFLPILLLVPLLAITCAGVALYQMSDDTSGQGGRWMAVAGLAIALFCSGAAVAREIVRTSVLRAEARSIAEGWLELLRAGDLPAAHQMTIAHRERQPAGTDLKLFYGSGSRKEDLANFFESPPLDRILKHVGQGQFAFEQDNSIGRADNEEYVDQLYRLDWLDSKGQPQQITFRMVLERTLHPTGGFGRWRILNVAPPTKG